MRRISPILVALALTTPLLAQTAPKTLSTKDTIIGRLALFIAPESIRLSPDGQHLAFAAKSSDPTLEDKGIWQDKAPPDNTNGRPPPGPPAQMTIYLDDKRGPAFDALTMPVFSPDSQRLAYAGQKKDERKNIPKPERQDKWEVRLDHKLVFTAEGVPLVPVAFSPDSNRFAITHMRGGDWFVRLDEKDLPAHDGVGDGTLRFSPDSQKVAYITKKKTWWTPYIDAVPGESFDRFGQFEWLPNSAGIAFVAAKKSQRWQVFAPALNFESPQFDAHIANSLLLSSDSKRLAYATVSKKQIQVFTNDAAPTPPPLLDQLRTESLSFLASDGTTPDKLLYIGQLNKRFRIFLDHQPLAPEFDAIFDDTFVLSPNRKHYAFAAKIADKAVIVRDGKITGNFQSVGSSTFSFSPDSQRLACSVANADKWYICLDGKLGKPLTNVASNPVAWSPDSQSVAFQAIDLDKKWRLFIDPDLTHQSAPYLTFFKNARVIWRPDNTLLTIAIQKKLALRVEASISR